MPKNKSFQEQYPDYQLIPEKKTAWKWALIWGATLVLVLGVPGFMFYRISQYQVPTPAIVGNAPLTLDTLKALALSQSEAGDHAEAEATLARYFALGGSEADMMAMYAYTLKELGRQKEAKVWSRHALAKDPNSKAARLIHDALEKD